MTNTYLLAGNEDPDEIVAQTPTGVYVAKLGGGQVNTATGDFVFGTTEAYLIEDGRITEPLRDANLIGNGPEVLRRIDAVANDFDMTPGTCGKDGPERPGRLRPGDPADHRRDARGDGVSGATSLDAGPAPVVDAGSPGRGARGLRRPGHRDRGPGLRGRGRVARPRPTRRASASVSSRGADGRGARCFAWAGLARRRGRSPPRWPMPATTPASPPPTPTWSWPSPTGCPPSNSTCGTTGWPDARWRRRSRWPSSSSAGHAAADPRVRQVSSADYGDSAAEVALASTTGISCHGPAHDCRLSVDGHRRRGRRHPDRWRVQRRARARRDLDARRGHGRRRAAGHPHARRAARSPSGRCTVVFDPRVVSTLLGVIASALSGEAVVKGRSFFAGRIGEEVAVARGHPGRRPHRRPGLRRLAVRRRGSGLPAQRPDRGRGAARFVFDTVSARRAGTASTASAVRGGYAATPVPGAGPSCSRRGHSTPERSWPRSARPSTCSR